MAGRVVGIASDGYMNEGGRGVYSTPQTMPAATNYKDEKAATDWTSQPAAFEPPKYVEPNLFAPPPQKPVLPEPTPVLEPTPAKAPLTSIFAVPTKPTTQPQVNIFDPAPVQTSPKTLFEVPKPQEVNIFDTSPVQTQSRPMPTFAMPAKPEVQQESMIFDPAPAKPQPQSTPTTLFNVPTKSQVSIFALPTNPTPSVSTVPKAEAKTGIFTMSSGSPKAAQPSLLPAVPSAQPKGNSDLDGLFTATPPVFQPVTPQSNPTPPSPPSVRHNMAVPMSSVAQKTNSEPRKPINLESLLVDLDNLKVEAKAQSEGTHLQGFGVSI